MLPIVIVGPRVFWSCATLC